MRRRDVITLLGGGLAWPLDALAQGSAIPVIGFLNSESPKPFAQLVAAFRQGLNEQGYVDGRNVKIEERWAEGDENRLAALARELVDRKVSLIAATGGIRSAQAAKQATSTIPALFITGVNPVDIGLVSSMSRPGHNLTGVNFDTTRSTAKRLEILQELVPVDTRVAVLAGPGQFAPEADAKFHGGTWRTGSARRGGFAAEIFLDNGANYVALDFINVIDAGGDLRIMADQVRRGIAWVYKNAESFGGDANKLYVGGSTWPIT